MKKLITAATLTGLGALGWSLIEAKAFILRRFEVPVLPTGADPIKVLHISDLHLTPFQQDKVRWVRDLIRFEPDLVVNTGDNLAHQDAVYWALEAMRPFAGVPGVFALGSNDFHGPQLKNPARYLLADARARKDHQTGDSTPEWNPPTLPGELLVAGLNEWGWLNLENARGRLTVRGSDLAFVGVSDAHRRIDEMPEPDDSPADLRVAVSHAPYQRVLDGFTADGADVALFGHTHGGQLCIPGVGALTTNCDLPASMAKGVHRWPASEKQSDGMWFHVSAGLGTSPFTPVRFACRPEASLVTLVPRTS